MKVQTKICCVSRGLCQRHLHIWEKHRNPSNDQIMRQLHLLLMHKDTCRLLSRKFFQRGSKVNVVFGEYFLVVA